MSGGWSPSSKGGSGRPARRPLTFAGLTSALRRAGLRSGDVVLVHSDVSTIGPTEAGVRREDILAFYLRAFREVLTESGTLAVCTAFEDYGRHAAPFICEESPSRLGSFSEYVRTRPGAVRSAHPIVSVAALGPRAGLLCGGPHYDGFGYDSPWGRLHRMRGKLLLLGLGAYPEMNMTFLHYVEHLYGVPYQYTKVYRTPVYAQNRELPGPFTMSVRYLDYGVTYDNLHFRRDLLKAGIAKNLRVGRDRLFVASADAVVERAIARMREDRYYFLKAPPRFRPGEIPMDGPTGEMRYAYDRGKGMTREAFRSRRR